MARGLSDAVLRPLRALYETGSVAGMTDGQLLERFAVHRDSGAETAFAALVQRHGPMVLGVCRYWLRNEHAADDAFQAVFLVLARRAGSIRHPERLSPWLHGVAVRIARKARNQAERRARREGRAMAMSDGETACPEPDPSRLQAEEIATVHEEVGRLPERYRRAVVLCHFEGLTHAEAANRLGCAPGTVGSLVSRARDMLRSRLARRGLSSGAILLAGSLEKIATAAVPPTLERSTIQAALIFTTNRAATAGMASATAVELARGALGTMTMTKLTIVGAVLALGAFTAGAGGFPFGSRRPADPGPHRAQAQAQRRAEPAPVPTPSIPGAVTQPPPWLTKDAIFDVAAFLATPPPEENAASRYLEALFEFGSELAVCFPEGPDRESRKQAADQRAKRYRDIDRAQGNAPNSVPTAQIDALVDSYSTGFRKLDWAQQRPKCVFPSALGVTAQIPHAQVARQVARITVLKVRREIDRGELDAALRDVARLLRFSRDLLPRGVLIVNLVSTAIDIVTVKSVIVPLLAAPDLTIVHCDRLLALLAEHEARSVDAYTEGLRAEYLSNRATLHDLVFDQARLRTEWNRLSQPAGPSIVAEIAEPAFQAGMASNAKMPKPGFGGQLKAIADWIMSLKNVKDLDARIARTTPEELTKQVEKVNELYRGLLNAANAPYPERVSASTELPSSLNGSDVHTQVTRGILQSAFTAFTVVTSRSKATKRVAQGLVAVRRWQLRHGGTQPPSLAIAVKEAGLSHVPIDPSDNQPIRFAVVDGQPTVYSIGQDGRDDGGKIDNTKSPYSGDLLLRLPGH